MEKPRKSSAIFLVLVALASSAAAAALYVKKISEENALTSHYKLNNSIYKIQETYSQIQREQQNESPNKSIYKVLESSGFSTNSEELFKCLSKDSCKQENYGRNFFLEFFGEGISPEGNIIGRLKYVDYLTNKAREVRAEFTTLNLIHTDGEVLELDVLGERIGFRSAELPAVKFQFIGAISGGVAEENGYAIHFTGKIISVSEDTKKRDKVYLREDIYLGERILYVYEYYSDRAYFNWLFENCQTQDSLVGNYFNGTNRLCIIKNTGLRRYDDKGDFIDASGIRIREAGARSFISPIIVENFRADDHYGLDLFTGLPGVTKETISCKLPIEKYSFPNGSTAVSSTLKRNGRKLAVIHEIVFPVEGKNKRITLIHPGKDCASIKEALEFYVASRKGI